MAMVLAGGAGTGLEPLTRERAKPAVSFAGRYRVIDFGLSNFVNSGISRLEALTQDKCDSLNNHACSAMPAVSSCGTATGAWRCAFGRCVVEGATELMSVRPEIVGP